MATFKEESGGHSRPYDNVNSVQVSAKTILILSYKSAISIE